MAIKTYTLEQLLTALTDAINNGTFSHDFCCNEKVGSLAINLDDFAVSQLVNLTKNDRGHLLATPLIDDEILVHLGDDVVLVNDQNDVISASSDPIKHAVSNRLKELFDYDLLFKKDEWEL